MPNKHNFINTKVQHPTCIKPLQRIYNFLEFHQHLSLDQQSIQASRCMNCGVAFCQSGLVIQGKDSGCPLNNLIPEWNNLMKNHHYKEALNRLLKTNNFPEFTARVCPALCKQACTLGLIDEPVTIQENEYSLIEEGFNQGWIKPNKSIKRNGYRIAIIGSGPAGLSAGDLLNKLGYAVTIYEKDDQIGGLLRYGIPNMKLEKWVIDRRVSLMKEEGISFIVNHPIHCINEVDDLLNEYDRIVVACGSGKSRTLSLPDIDHKDVIQAIDFLKQATKQYNNRTLNLINLKDKRILIIGGGDTGNDCVATAVRLQCKEIIQVEIMPKQKTVIPWPLFDKQKEINYGHLEYIEKFNKDTRIFSSTVTEIIIRDGSIVGAIIEKVQWDNTSYKIVENSKKEIEVDIVLLATGFNAIDDKTKEAFSMLPKSFNESFITSHPYVFVAGDANTGPKLVVHAIDQGRKVAKLIHDSFNKRR